MAKGSVDPEGYNMVVGTLIHLHNMAAKVPYLKQFTLLIGTIMIMRAAYCIIKLVVSLLKPRKDLTSHGKWAVVTGATDGIGKAIALQLARRNLNLMLISRTLETLNKTIQEIESVPGYSGEVRILSVDFATAGDDVYEDIRKSLNDLDIGILVNNVGQSYPHAMYFNEVPSTLLDSLLNVNLRSTLKMTHIVLEGMSKRKRGLIVCVGSGASELPCDPMYSAYAAVKAAVGSFCTSLQVEVKKFGVLVQCHTPLLVTTKLSKCHSSSLTIPNPTTYAKSAIAAMERCTSCGSASMSPYIPHRLMLAVINAMPRCMWNKLRLSQTTTIRSKALKKQQQSEGKKGN